MKPTLQALLLADRIYREEATGKHIIAGTFNTMLLVKDRATPKAGEVDGEQKPFIRGGMQSGSPYAFVSLTEIHGKVDCVLRYVSLEQDKPLLETRFSIQSDNPLETVEIMLPMPPLPQQAGVHALELLCGDEPIGSLRVIVKEMKEEGNVDNSSA